MPRARAVAVMRLANLLFGAGNVLGDDAGHVVGRQRDERLDGVLDRDGGAGLQAELGRHGGGGVLATRSSWSESLRLPALSSWNRM